MRNEYLNKKQKEIELGNFIPNYTKKNREISILNVKRFATPFADQKHS